MVRIITGTAKGMQLKVPHKARPIGDRAKSSIFSVIGPDIVGKRILDLYAGSGALGIEALSRGADYCLFVESDRYAVDDIKANLVKTKLEDKGKATRQKVLPFLDNYDEEPFDIVFADPPYVFYKDRKDRTQLLLEKIIAVIPSGGAIILKHPAKLDPPQIEGLVLADQRKFGANTISMWVKVSFSRTEIPHVSKDEQKEIAAALEKSKETDDNVVVKKKTITL